MSTLHFSLPFTLTYEQQKILTQRIAAFKALGIQGNKEWFSELCFCLLTANAQAQKALILQETITAEGFLTLPESEIARAIRAQGHRFHNTKAHYIVAARAYKTIKDFLHGMDTHTAREFLVSHIKGLGYKEASHFLRNVGYEDIAIIDRHIIRFLVRYGFIKQMPKTITKKVYLELEEILKKFDICLNALDLMIWCHMTGTILK